MARIEPISLAQNEPKRIGPLAKSGTDQNEMPGTITPKWVAQNEPKYPLEKGKVTNEDIRRYLKPILNEKNEPIHFRLIFQLLEEVESKNLLDEDIAKDLKTIPNDIQERYTKHFETEEKNDLLDDFIYFLD